MYIQANIKKVFAVCLLVFVSLAAIAQSGDIITGTVKTEQGETLVGAYVNVVGTQIKAVTNAKGHDKCHTGANFTGELYRDGYTTSQDNSTIYGHYII